MFPNTETLDKLYLEWSQFTQARTGREMELEVRLAEANQIIKVLRGLLLEAEQGVSHDDEKELRQEDLYDRIRIVLGQ